MKTTREIVEESFKNQDFNQKQSYKDITTVFDTLEWIEKPTDKWFSEEEYNDLKDIYELTKISHAEMCEEVIKLRKYLERYKFNIGQLQKELKEQFENDLILVEEDIDKIFNYYKVK